MPSYRVGLDAFTHVDALDCLCPDCCAGIEPERDHGAAMRGLERAAGSLALHFSGAAAPTLPFAGASSFEEQQAVQVSVTYDTVTNDADQGVDALVKGLAWDRLELTYSFPNSPSDYTYSQSYGFAPLAAAVQDATRSVLDAYAEIAPFTFTELAGTADRDADLAFAEAPSHNTAFAYYPSSGDWGGDVWYGPAVDAPLVGTWDYMTVLHEVGHALGLKHGQDESGPGAIPYEINSMEYSVMTYYSYVGQTGGGYTNSYGDYAQSLMMLDIAAIQRIYGANFAHAAGDTVYSFSTATGRMYVDGVDAIAAAGLTKTGQDTVFRTIWDGGGTDTYDFSNYTTDLGVDLAPGGHVDLDVGGTFQRARLKWDGTAPEHWARGHVFNAMQAGGDERSLIENARGGSGDDWFRGNAADNAFWGNGGNDSFHDSAGSDRYDGGAGADSLFFGGAFSGYSFDISGSFLQVIGAAIDWVANTVEQVVFGGSDSWSFAALWDLAAGTPANAAPVAAADSVATQEDRAVSFGVLANDSDPDGDALTIAAFGQARNGTVALNGGTFTYTPKADYFGTDSFTYTVSDGRGGSATATVTLSVSAVNDAPDARDDAAATDQGVAVAVAVLANDVDVDGDTLSVSGYAQGAHGSVTRSGGILTYAPEAGWSGTDSFTYSVSDGHGGSDSATVTVTVSAAPVPLLASALTVDFEGLPGGAYGGTAGLAFTGLTVQSTSTLDGAKAGITGRDGRLEVLATDGDFDFDGALFRSVKGSASITVEAWDDGVLVGTQTLSSHFKDVTDAGFGTAFDSIDRLVIDADRQIRVDDLDFVTYGETTPSSAAGAVVLGFEGASPDEDGFVFADTGLTTGNRGVVGGAQAAASDGDSMSFGHADSFDFVSGWFTAADGHGVTLTVEGWLDGARVAVETAVIDDRFETEVTLGSGFGAVDEVHLSAPGGVMADDLSFVF